MIQHIDRETLKGIRLRMEVAIYNEFKDDAETLKVHVGRCVYTPDQSATFKVEFNLINADGNVLTGEAEAFKVYAPLDGIPKESLYTEFRDMKGRFYKLVGFNTKARKSPYLALCLADNKTYKFPTEYLKACLERSKK